MSGYIGIQPVPQATQTRNSFTATAGQTTFATDGYTPGYLDVFLNGVKLTPADFTASNGSDVVLVAPSTAGDTLEVVAYTAFNITNVSGATNFSVSNNITVGGTVDGRDVAADGAVIDSLATVATTGSYTDLADIPANIVTDASYVHTDNNYTTAEKSKLAGIEANAKDDQTIIAGSGLTGGGLGDVTLNHAATSSQASVNNAGATVIQDVTLDGFGHVTGLASKGLTLGDLGFTGATNANYITDNNQIANGAGYTTNVGDITGVTAGSGLTGGGTSGAVTVSHADTSSQGSVNNSGSTVIQDITLDTYGHITNINSTTISASPSTSYNAVGTYAALQRTSGNQTVSQGSTYSGSGLRPSGWLVRTTTNGINYRYASQGTVSGTWRCMGYSRAFDNNWAATTVFVRIS